MSRCPDDAAVLDHLLGREVYRRTEWLLLRNGADCALVEVRKASYEPLFSPVVEARVLAGPDRTTWIVEPETDVGNATALAAAAAPYRQPGIDAYAIQGRYEHINVIWQPAPIRIVVTEVVPPEPPKLLERPARPSPSTRTYRPSTWSWTPSTSASWRGRTPHPRYLLPCRGSGVDLGAPVSFLDTRPAQRGDWLLIGCERSMQFHRHFYGDEPPRVDLCPPAGPRTSRRDAGADQVLPDRARAGGRRGDRRGALGLQPRRGARWPCGCSPGSARRSRPRGSVPPSRHERAPHRLGGLRPPVGDPELHRTVRPTRGDRRPGSTSSPPSRRRRPTSGSSLRRRRRRSAATVTR